MPCIHAFELCTTRLARWAAHITDLVHEAITNTNLVAYGSDSKQIGIHSNWASRDMALKLQGMEDSLIMKSGCRMGLTFSTYYIHSQIGALNAPDWLNGWPFASTLSKFLDTPCSPSLCGLPCILSPTLQVKPTFLHKPWTPLTCRTN
jgi:hypothetical protein